jgi:hypothetical protein
MLGRLARGAYMLAVVTMIVAWAVSASKSTPAPPEPEDAVVTWWC